MNDVLMDYLTSFLHPWQTQEMLRSKRELNQAVQQTQQLELVESRKEKLVEEPIGVNFTESLMVSWLFIIFNSFYSLIGMFMGLHLFESFSLENPIISYGQSMVSFFSIFGLLGKVVFFPLVFWLYGKFWINIIKVFAMLFEKEGDFDKIASEIVANSLTSHTFLVIPIIGEVFHQIASLVYLFGGLRRNLGMSALQSTLVILCPLLLILFAIFLMVLSFAMMLSGF